MAETIAWDRRQHCVITTRERRLGALVLSSRPIEQADPEAVTIAMLEGIRAMGLEALPWTDGVRALHDRVAFLRKLFPDAGWPDWSVERLLAEVDVWLAPYVAGLSRRTHLERLDLQAILRGQLTHEHLQQLDRLAPTSIGVPSGASIRIDYGGGEPKLSVRLQEMFGLAQTPVIADGKARLRIELLSPARRPLAVTQSLETFWQNVYPQVRGEMRGRYPKHVWPEDPLSVAPVRPNKLR